MFSPSVCCGNIVRLSDLVGKPIEFRKFLNFAPQIGTRWACPTCDLEYFARWGRSDFFWDDIKKSREKYILDNNGNVYFNDFQNKFIFTQEGQLVDTGFFIIILELYENIFSDSPMKKCDQEINCQLVIYNSNHF